VTGNGIRVLNIAGIPIYVHASWLWFVSSGAAEAAAVRNVKRAA
jgi:hypothetical protein